MARGRFVRRCILVFHATIRRTVQAGRSSGQTLSSLESSSCQGEYCALWSTARYLYNTTIFWSNKVVALCSRPGTAEIKRGDGNYAARLSSKAPVTGSKKGLEMTASGRHWHFLLLQASKRRPGGENRGSRTLGYYQGIGREEMELSKQWRTRRRRRRGGQASPAMCPFVDLVPA